MRENSARIFCGLFPTPARGGVCIAPGFCTKRRLSSTDQNVGFDSLCLLMPDGSQAQIALLQAKSISGIGQLHIGFPKMPEPARLHCFAAHTLRCKLSRRHRHQDNRRDPCRVIPAAVCGADTTRRSNPAAARLLRSSSRPICRWTSSRTGWRAAVRRRSKLFKPARIRRAKRA